QYCRFLITDGVVASGPVVLSSWISAGPLPILATAVFPASEKEIESSRVENFPHLTGKTTPSTLPIASRCSFDEPLSKVTTAHASGIPGPGFLCQSPPRSPEAQTSWSERSTSPQWLPLRNL